MSLSDKLVLAKALESHAQKVSREAFDLTTDIISGLLEGASTGDRIKDFCIGTFHSLDSAYEDSFRELDATFRDHNGEFVMVLHHTYLNWKGWKNSTGSALYAHIGKIESPLEFHFGNCGSKTAGIPNDSFIEIPFKSKLVRGFESEKHFDMPRSNDVSPFGHVYGYSTQYRDRWEHQSGGHRISLRSYIDIPCERTYWEKSPNITMNPALSFVFGEDAIRSFFKGENLVGAIGRDDYIPMYRLTKFRSYSRQAL